MNYYLDITILPDQETGLGFLWQKIYQQVHLAFVDNKLQNNRSAVGVAFPMYGKMKFPAGNKLRLFAHDKTELEELELNKWLVRFNDYCHQTSIKEVPGDVEYAIFSRKPVKSIEKKAAARAEHLKIEYEKALSFLKKEGKSELCTLPFIQMESQSSHSASIDKNRFKLFIDCKKSDSLIAGDFDCYGLSKTTTVPWF